MALKFQSVNAFTCERVLVEQDGVISAIRMVDLFNIAADAPPEPTIQFWLVVILKVLPVPEEEIRFGITQVRTSGERTRLPSPAQALKFGKSGIDDPAAPGGAVVLAQFNLTIKHFGTSYLEVDVDGNIVANVPITVRKLAANAELQ